MKRYLVALVLAVSFIATSISVPAGAVNVFGGCQSGIDCGVVKDDSLNYATGGKRVWGAISLVLSILAGVAVVMIIVGGIQYATSGGESSKVATAKNTILYSVIGLVVALSAAAIVALVNTYFG